MINYNIYGTIGQYFFFAVDLYNLTQFVYLWSILHKKIFALLCTRITSQKINVIFVQFHSKKFVKYYIQILIELLSINKKRL